MRCRALVVCQVVQGAAASTFEVLSKVPLLPTRPGSDAGFDAQRLAVGA